MEVLRIILVTLVLVTIGVLLLSLLARLESRAADRPSGRRAAADQRAAPPSMRGAARDGPAVDAAGASPTRAVSAERR